MEYARMYCYCFVVVFVLAYAVSASKYNQCFCLFVCLFCCFTSRVSSYGIFWSSLKVPYSIYKTCQLNGSHPSLYGLSEAVRDWPFIVDSLDLHQGGSTTVSFNVQKPQGTGVCKVSFYCSQY